MLIFEPTVYSSATDKQSKLCLNFTSQLRQNAHLQCADIQVMLLGKGDVGGGRFWLHKETLTFKFPAAKQATAIYLIGVNKTPSEFDTSFLRSLLFIRQFNGLSVQCFSGYFGSKELNGTSCIACVSVVHILYS